MPLKLGKFWKCLTTPTPTSPSKERRIAQIETEAQQIHGVQTDLVQAVEGMLAAHGFGLAVHWIRTAVDEVDGVPPLVIESSDAPLQIATPVVVQRSSWGCVRDRTEQ